jgi:hypothetical protein
VLTAASVASEASVLVGASVVIGIEVCVGTAVGFAFEQAVMKIKKNVKLILLTRDFQTMDTFHHNFLRVIVNVVPFPRSLVKANVP